LQRRTLKAGRVLSAANESSLRNAIRELEAVLSQLDQAEESSAEITIDGVPVGEKDVLGGLKAEDIRTIITGAVDEGIMAVTGRLAR
jgi:hypothetical protein